MNRVLLITFLILSATIVSAQELNVQVGKSISTFKYHDSQGKKLENLQPTDHFFMTLEYRQNIFKKYLKDRFFADLGLGYYKYGAAGSDPAVDNYFAWDVTYMAINLGLDYEFYRPGRFTFYAKATASPEFLIRGTQRLNDQVYNLVGEDDFNSPIYFFRGGLGVQYQLTDQAMLYIQYMGGKSFNFNNDPEKLNIVAHNFGFGILIKLSKGQYESGRTDLVGEKRMIEMENKIDVYAEKIDKLEVQAERVEELELAIIAKDVEMKALKDIISSSLFDFEGEGLYVDQRQGKVYVSMNNDMLFESGSWIVGDEGIKAVEALGRGLAQNPEISILIEGHTDNQPYIGTGNIENNWDLSMKRATAIVEILSKNPDIDSRNLTAAGRGEHAPIASNDTIEGRAKNRRIEVIITPQLEEVSKILK